MKAREIKQNAKAIIASGFAELEATAWGDINSNTSPEWLEDYQEFKSVYLGTVFNIMPSGKFYMPWANSNVDACPRCKGAGCDHCGDMGSREAFEDSIMQEAMEDYAGELGCTVESGEGDPCDLFLIQTRDIESKIEIKMEVAQ